MHTFSKHEAIAYADERVAIEGVPVYVLFGMRGFTVTTEERDADLCVYTAWPYSVKAA